MTDPRSIGGLDIIIVGGGGHARVACDAARLAGSNLLGYVDPANEIDGPLDLQWLGDDTYLDTIDPARVKLINGIGSTGDASARRGIYERMRTKGFQFPVLIHPSAVVAPSVTLESGVQVMAGAVIQPGTHIGKNTIINTRASIDHDCRIGAHVHIAPGATLAGCVEVCEEAHVGLGACILQGLRIGARTLVGAGAAVTRNASDGRTLVGVPANEID